MATENKLEQQKNIADFKIDINKNDIGTYEAGLKIEEQITAEVEEILQGFKQENNNETTPPADEVQKTKEKWDKVLELPVKDWDKGGDIYRSPTGVIEVPKRIYLDLQLATLDKLLTKEEAGVLIRKFSEKWAEERNSLKPLSPEEKAKREAARKESLKSQVE